MLLVYSYCQKDEELAVKNAEWIQSLGGCDGHKCLVVRDVRSTRAPFKFLEQSFESVEELVNKRNEPDTTWPVPQNHQFQLVARYIEDICPQPWLWFESDAIPIKPGWLDKIRDEYNASKKPFMGALVVIKDVPTHCSGVALYPGKLSWFAGDTLFDHYAQDGKMVAWDIVGAEKIVPRMHNTKLIRHDWRHPKFENREEVDKLLAQYPECVLFHSSKDGSLIDTLRQERGDVNANGNTELSMTDAEQVQSPTASPVSLEEKHEESQNFQPKNGEDREALVRDTVAILKQLCTAPRYTHQVRKQLRLQGVIK